MNPNDTNNTVDTDTTDNASQDDHSPYITVYKPIAGRKAIMYHFNTADAEGGYLGFWEPWATGFQGHATREEAVLEAKSWAEAEDIRLNNTTIPSNQS